VSSDLDPSASSPSPGRTGPAWIDLPGVVNMRDLGGLPLEDGGVISHGRLLRSGMETLRCALRGATSGQPRRSRCR